MQTYLARQVETERNTVGHHLPVAMLKVGKTKSRDGDGDGVDMVGEGLTAEASEAGLGEGIGPWVAFLVAVA